MKKKFFLLLIMFSTAVISISAAEQRRENEYLGGNFWSHWYASFGVGAEFHIQQNDVTGYTFDEFKPAPTFSLSLGKWINPYFGVRAQYNMSFDKASTTYTNRYTDASTTDFKGILSVLHADAMFNFNSIVAGHKEDRFYELYPYFGLSGGWFYPENDRIEREIMLKAGLVNNFRLSDKFSAVIEASYLHNNVVIYGMPKGSPRIFPINLTAGLTYHFGGRDFYSTDEIYDEAYKTLAPLKKQNSELLADNDALKAKNDALADNIDDLESQIAKANALISELEGQDKLIPIPAFFKINSSRITKEHVGTFKFAAAEMKSDDSKKYVVYGYADSATGNDKINTRLAQDRADAIVKVLVDKYGVNPSQVRAVGKGGVDDVFEEITLNRCVILKSDK